MEMDKDEIKAMNDFFVQTVLDTARPLITKKTQGQGLSL
jgi:hypothetical protein